MHYTREQFESMADHQRSQMQEFIDNHLSNPAWDVDTPRYLMFRFDPEGTGKYGGMPVPEMPDDWDLDTQKEAIQKVLEALDPPVDVITVLAGGYKRDPTTMQRCGEIITIYVEARNGDAVMYVWDLVRNEGAKPTLTPMPTIKSWVEKHGIGGRMCGYFPPVAVERTLVN